MQSLEKTLKHDKKVKQSYHSRSFVGNHCSKYIRVSVQDDISATLQEKTCELSGKSNISKRVQQICKILNKLNGLYINVHNMAAHMTEVDDDAIEIVQQNIEKYLAYYRKHFPNSIFPKQNFLEDVPWMKRWQFGLSLHGEQGREAIHHEINRIQRNMYHVADPSKKFLCTIQEHHVLTNPELQGEIVQPKKRKI